MNKVAIEAKHDYEKVIYRWRYEHMDVTIKCPNCYQQVSKDNRFCIFCGYDLSDMDSSSSVELSTGGAVTDDRPAAYDGPRYCPKGHNVEDPSLGFCPTCGSPLVFEAASGGKVEEERSFIPEVRRYASRTCKCGYACDDPDLSFCPSCGLPLETEDTIALERWECICGATNDMDLGFCEECGKPKGWRPSSSTSTPEDKMIEIPSGMVPLTESDLCIKSKYGN